MKKYLTPRRKEVFALACQYPNREVARLLGISEQTVKNHIQDIFPVVFFQHDWSSPSKYINGMTGTFISCSIYDLGLEPWSICLQWFSTHFI